MTATSFVAIALIVLLLPSPLPPPPPSFPFPTDTNEDHLAFASSSISGSQTTVTLPPPPPSSLSAPSSTLDNESTQLSQAQIGEGPGPSSDNFNLPTGYIMEPFLENLSMPTSIAIDSKNGTIYVAESINEYGNDNSSILTSSLSPHSFLSQQPQVRIVKDEISNHMDTTVNQTLNHAGDEISNNGNSSNIINAALNWPVIDMEVDDTTGLLYALHDLTTISRINTTSGEREDILAREEAEQSAAAAAAGMDKYEEEQQDPLSFLIRSSSQIVLSRNEDHYDAQYDIGGVDGGNSSNPDSYNFTTMLYVPCMNDDANNSNYGTYCILGLPIDRNDNSAIVDSFGSINPSSSSILENMTSRPVGIATLNSSSQAATPSSSSSLNSSLPSPLSVSEQQRPYAPTGSQTSNALFNNSENDLLIITSQLPSNSDIFSNTNNDNYNEQNHISYGISSSNYSSDAATLSSLNTIYHVKVFDSMPYPGNSSNNLQDTIINNSDYSDSSNYNDRQQAPPPSMEVLADYPYGRLGQVAVVSVPSISVPSTTVTISSSTSSSSSANETIQTNQTPSIEEDNLSSSSPLPFGLNKTTAFIVDFGNSSGSAAALNLPKIIMLDVQTGNITPFLSLKHSDPSFTPIDMAFDYNSSALYVLSTGNNQEGDANNDNTTDNTNNLLNADSPNNNNSGIIWRISYQGEEQEAATSSNSSGTSIDNVTDNDDSDINNVTSSLTSPQPSSSSNDTDSSDNSTDSSNDSNGLDDSSSSYDEEEDTTDDVSSGTDNGGNDSSGEEDTEDNSGSSESSSPGDSAQESPPSTEPVNTAPIAEDDAATTDQDTPIIIDVLANDMDEDEDDSLTIDSVDEQSVQEGNVRIIGSGDDDGSNDNDNNDSGGNTNEKIEYVPAEGFSGTDEFTYTIVDTNGAKGSATVTVTVNEVVVVPHPTSYWLDNEDGITGDLLEKAAEQHENNNNDDKWSFNLGDFRVPVKFDVSDSKNDTKGILEGGEGNSNNVDDDVNKTNTYDQLAAQLLAAKLNIENGVITCESIETTIENADTVLVNAQYAGPGTTETPAGKSRDHASELTEVLDKYNLNGCA
jgi:Bacterial Ig domain